MAISEFLNMDYLESQYRLWREDPRSVPRDWRLFFEGFELAGAGRAPAPAESREGVCADDAGMRQVRVDHLIYRYRDIGHLLACLDPLVACPTDHPLLSLSAFRLGKEDLEDKFCTRGLSQDERLPLREILSILRETYSRSVGVEFMHIQDPEERRWLEDRMESTRNRPDLDLDARIRILNKLFQAAVFEQYLNKKYTGQTRFSLEGAEALIPLLDEVARHTARQGCREIILGMAHRGRLNVQTNILFKTYEEIFREFENAYDPDSIVGSGDVKYHNGYLTDLTVAEDLPLRVFLVNNPSHLEAVNPVVEGIARARQDQEEDGERTRILPLLIHGDAAFAGQGIVAETLNFSQLRGYRTGGTLHVVINNQIGYTTLPEDARSTRYSTDVAKMLMVPIFHVHGENPEAVIHVARLACDYRNHFGKDVVIDLVCYRRYGHNEGDEPYFTQPQMYERIRERTPLHRMYAQTLVKAETVTEEDVTGIEEGITQCLEAAYSAAKENPKIFTVPKFYEVWEGLDAPYTPEPVETGVPADTLKKLSDKLTERPKGFSIYSKLEKLLDQRREAVASGEGIDWANAESLAFASLLAEDIPVRLSGQDSGRGTFSQRHSVLVDTETGEKTVPLNHLDRNQARFAVYDSMLSEAGILGFEYGYSLVRPRSLVLWEAQFGDFANNAQSIIDLFIASGETKWQRRSGLTLLLPHGLEGLGPEHSSCRPERFLQLCAGDNMLVCNPTTPAQYFHLLRRQAKAPYRKPLVVLTPKSLLRHPQAVSTLGDLTDGFFRPVLDDPGDISSPRQVLFCSGKIYYALAQEREKAGITDTAIVRVEQLNPFPEEELTRVIRRYEGTAYWSWVQEEPENMGAWSFMRHRLSALTGADVAYVGREPSPSPATGFANIYRQIQENIIKTALGAEADTRKAAVAP